MAKKSLSQDHEVFISGIGHIEFEHGKFRIMLNGDPLIPEIAVYFEDPLQPPYYKPF